MDVILISPTEPKELRELGTVSLLTEEHGADVLIWNVSTGGWMGVQRKEMGDLVASIGDGRFAEQMMKMKESLGTAVLLIEGRGEWGSDGKWMRGYGAKISWDGIQQLLNSVRCTGVWTVATDRLSGPCSTIAWLTGTESWAKKETHSGLLNTRGPVKKSWGTAESRDYQRHLLLGLEGCGPELGDRILTAVGMPFGWRHGMPDGLSVVPGIGPKRIAKWLKAVPLHADDGGNVGGDGDARVSGGTGDVLGGGGHLRADQVSTEDGEDRGQDLVHGGRLGVGEQGGDLGESGDPVPDDEGGVLPEGGEEA